MEQLLQQAELVVTAHEWGFELLGPPRAAPLPHDAQGLPRRNATRLALEDLLADLLERHAPAGRAVRGLAHDHARRRGDGLQPRCRVDDVARNHALALGAERHGRLSGGDAGPRRQAGMADAHAERADRIDEVEPGPHRPLRVVLVGHGRAPDRHHGVADELLDGAAVALDDVASHVEVAGQQLANSLRVARFGEAGEPDEVGEQDAHEPPFRGGIGPVEGGGRAGGRHRAVAPGCPTRCGGERRATFGAELHRGRVRKSAARAGHGKSRATLRAELVARLVRRTAVRTVHPIPWRRRIAVVLTGRSRTLLSVAEVPDRASTAPPAAGGSLPLSLSRAVKDR